MPGFGCIMNGMDFLGHSTNANTVKIAVLHVIIVLLKVLKPHIWRNDTTKEVALDFSLTDEQKMIQQTVRQFVDRELMPLENEVLQNEGKYPNGVEPSLYHALKMKAKEMSFWGINTS
jgi:hypothetical protein